MRSGLSCKPVGTLPCSTWGIFSDRSTLPHSTWRRRRRTIQRSMRRVCIYVYAFCHSVGVTAAISGYREVTCMPSVVGETMEEEGLDSCSLFENTMCFELDCNCLWSALTLYCCDLSFYISIHPSIFYTRLIRRSGRGRAGAYPSGHRARGGVTLDRSPVHHSLLHIYKTKLIWIDLM